MTSNNGRVCLSLAVLAAGNLPLCCPPVTKCDNCPLFILVSSAWGLQCCCLNQVAVLASGEHVTADETGCVSCQGDNQKTD